MKMTFDRNFLIYVVLFILFGKNGSLADTKDVENFLSQLLLEEPVDEAKCDRTVLEVAAIDSATVIDVVPRLHGKWVSQECEIRPGPEFVLRSYSFQKDNTFKVVQFYYADESCILPLFTVTAKGSLFLGAKSWVTRGATEADYALTKVTIIPHTTQIAEEFSKRANESCSGTIKKTWRPHKEYAVLRASSSDDGLFANADGEDCVATLGLQFNELQLVRTQTRPVGQKKNRELFLGDIHSRPESRFTYKPTGFQIPLLKVDQSYRCGNCHLIAKGTERSPPHLLSRPRLPPLPHGRWVSSRCEVRALGTFLRRRLSFDSSDRSWFGEFSFYSDPSCTLSAFTISASGRYSKGLGAGKDMQKRSWTGTKFDFKVDVARVTLHDKTLKETFEEQKDCGIGPWFVGIPKDLRPTGGCAMLGLVIPATEYELLKLEIDDEGNPLLLMGLPDTENRRRGYYERPTSYQPPLIQCSTISIQQEYNSNKVHPESFARRAARSSSASSCRFESSIFPIFFLLTVYYGF